MNRTTKERQINTLREKFRHATAVFVTGFRGMPVAEVTELRKKLRGEEVEYKVIKNSLVGFAAKDTLYQSLPEVIEGPTALVLTTKDPVSTAKILCEFLSDTSPFVIKAGFIESERFDGERVKVLSTLPGKEVLLAKLIGSAISPVQRWVMVLSAVPRGFVQVLQAIRQKKEQETSS